MATYGARPQTSAQPAGIGTPSRNKQSDSGLFADLFSSQPAPKNLLFRRRIYWYFFDSWL